MITDFVNCNILKDFFLSAVYLKSYSDLYDWNSPLEWEQFFARNIDFHMAFKSFETKNTTNTEQAPYIGCVKVQLHTLW